MCFFEESGWGTASFVCEILLFFGCGLGLSNYLFLRLVARHMAADEMRTITSDKWSDDVWGAASAREPIAKLFFYFGRNDHWVADQTRDDIVAVRGQKGGQAGPTMVVCEEGLPHAFCLSKWSFIDFDYDT